jgi:hypothetical protein
VTVKTKAVVFFLPSFLLTSLMLMRGSSSRIVLIPWPSVMTAFVGLLRLTTKVSLGSASRSPFTKMVTVMLVSPGAKVRVPLLAW